MYIPQMNSSSANMESYAVTLVSKRTDLFKPYRVFEHRQRPMLIKRLKHVSIIRIGFYLCLMSDSISTTHDDKYQVNAVQRCYLNGSSHTESKWFNLVISSRKQIV